MQEWKGDVDRLTHSCVLTTTNKVLPLAPKYTKQHTSAYVPVCIYCRGMQGNANTELPTQFTETSGGLVDASGPCVVYQSSRKQWRHTVTEKSRSNESYVCTHS